MVWNGINELYRKNNIKIEENSSGEFILSFMGRYSDGKEYVKSSIRVTPTFSGSLRVISQTNTLELTTVNGISGVVTSK